jgi:hypothetical protein
MDISNLNHINYEKIEFDEYISILPSKEAYSFGYEKGLLELNNSQKIFIKPAGYSQPINFYTLACSNFTQTQVEQNCKNFLSRKTIYDQIENQWRYQLDKANLAISLIHEKDNPYDNNAVACIITDTSEQAKKFKYLHIGYVPAQYSRLVKNNLSRFETGIIARIDGVKSPYYCWIEFSINKKKKLTNTRFSKILDNK